MVEWMNTIQLYCDASVSTRLCIATGIHIEDKDGNVLNASSQIIKKGQGYKLAINIGESLAIIHGLQKLIEMGLNDQDVIVHNDNLMVINIINNQMETEDIELKPVLLMLHNVLSEFEKEVIFKWVPRQLNTMAHKICRKVFEEQRMQRRARIIEIVSSEKNQLIAVNKKTSMKYVVNIEEPSCTCRTFRKQTGINKKPCKHIVAAKLYHNHDPSNTANQNEE